MHTANPHLKVLKPSSLHKDPLEELGGVGLRPVHMARKVGTETIKHMVIDTHKPGVALLDANTTPICYALSRVQDSPTWTAWSHARQRVVWRNGRGGDTLRSQA